MKNIVLTIAMALLLFIKGAAAQSSGEKQVRIRITSVDLSIEATLNNSAPAQDLLKKLPITLNLHQHQAREYYADIELDKNDITQAVYQVGDIAYWTPGNSLVFFYDKGNTGSLIIMGKMILSSNELSRKGSSFQVKIEKVED